MNSKTMVLLLAEILHEKGIINYLEYDAILDMRTNDDVYRFIDILIDGEYKSYVKGLSQFGTKEAGSRD